MMPRPDTSKPSELNKPVSRWVIAYAAWVVVIGFAPHVATAFYPEITLFQTLSERPAWWIYLMVVSLVGYAAITILAEMMRHR
jgi:hypothetical protein